MPNKLQAYVATLFAFGTGYTGIRAGAELLGIPPYTGGIVGAATFILLCLACALLAERTTRIHPALFQRSVYAVEDIQQGDLVTAVEHRWPRRHHARRAAKGEVVFGVAALAVPKGTRIGVTHPLLQGAPHGVVRWPCPSHGRCASKHPLPRDMLVQAYRILGQTQAGAPPQPSPAPNPPGHRVQVKDPDNPTDLGVPR